jgi:hypothetical protein
MHVYLYVCMNICMVCTYVVYMCVCDYLCMYVRVYVWIDVSCVYTHAMYVIHVYMRSFMYVCMFVWKTFCMYEYVRKYLCTYCCIYACTCVCMYVSIFIYRYLYLLKLIRIYHQAPPTRPGAAHLQHRTTPPMWPSSERASVSGGLPHTNTTNPGVFVYVCKYAWMYACTMKNKWNNTHHGAEQTVGNWCWVGGNWWDTGSTASGGELVLK